MLRQRPELKILIVRESGGSSHIFSVILITDFQCLEDVFGSFAFGGEVLDKGIDGGDGSNGGSGGCGRVRGFGVPNLLRTIVSLGFSRHLRRPAFVCAVSLLATSETESFSYAVSMICWRVFFQTDGVNIYGIGIFGGTRIGGKQGEG